MKRQTHGDIRRAALIEVRAAIRADILLDGPETTAAAVLDRVTKTLDRMISTVK
jgi:hypothetical protein